MFSDINYSLNFKDVSIRRGDNLLFADLNFAVKPGQAFWLQGANGSGKTTILRLATGLLQPESGSVSWSLNDTPCEPSDLMAYQGHTDALKSDLTVTEELEFWGDIYDNESGVPGILNAVQLGQQAPLRIRHLSAGQKRRLVFARLLLSQKPIWIMDEPTAAIDKAGQNLIHRLMTRHVKMGGAVLIATHGDAKLLNAGSQRLTLEAA